jgi:formylglycine-generating enzyme required for sulfatase activity
VMRGRSVEAGTPVHAVTLTKGFYLQATEVTQAQWQALMGGRDRSWSKGPDRPVDMLAWDETQEFLRRLNAKEKDTRYRLPTEAEWEYGCRAGGQEPDVAPNPGEVAWWADNSGREAHPVGLKKPNAWGLYDMRGNVFEFVQDWYGPYSAERQVDPQGPLSGVERVARGGWFGTPGVPLFLACSQRHSGGAERSRGPYLSHVGLRCARTF